MWKKIIMTLEKKASAFLPLSILLYISLTQIIPRNNYNFLREEPTEIVNSPKLTTRETKHKLKLREKLMQDLVYHKVGSDYNVPIVAKITLNDEGKIVGYKLYKVFYPNYFTETQIQNMFKGVNKFPSLSSNLHTITVTFYTLKTPYPDMGEDAHIRD
jgi:hypothetical protein